MPTDERLTTKRQTTDDPKTTVGFSLRRSLIERLRDRAGVEDVSISALASRLLKTGLDTLASTEN